MYIKRLRGRMEVFIRWCPGCPWLSTPIWHVWWSNHWAWWWSLEGWGQTQLYWGPPEGSWSRTFSSLSQWLESVGWSSECGGPGLCQHLGVSPTGPGGLRGSWTWETVELRGTLSPGVLIGSHYMRLLKGLLSLKEYPDTGSEPQRTDKRKWCT